MNGMRAISGLALAWCLATPALAQDEAGGSGETAERDDEAVTLSTASPNRERGAVPGLDRNQARKMLALMFASVGRGCARTGCAATVDR